MRLDIPIKQEIVESHPGLLEEFGFLITEDRRLTESFGNSYVTLQSSTLWVRFVRDRGQVWAEVAAAAAPTNWYPLRFVLETIRGQLAEPQFDLLTATRLLRDNFRDLADALGPKLPDTLREILKVLMGSRTAGSS
jgi:hypothetical protein